MWYWALYISFYISILYIKPEPSAPFFSIRTEETSIDPRSSTFAPWQFGGTVIKLTMPLAPCFSRFGSLPHQVWADVRYSSATSLVLVIALCCGGCYVYPSCSSKSNPDKLSDFETTQEPKTPPRWPFVSTSVAHLKTMLSPLRAPRNPKTFQADHLSEKLQPFLFFSNAFRTSTPFFGTFWSRLKVYESLLFVPHLRSKKSTIFCIYKRFCKVIQMWSGKE